eukprot:CAMPEP_0184753028 /NCGR_PEP_ID=MMETSP0315-20130426/43889_1 /TAXON_ID=101924 /ORGANISM="Rhodosorus marinus, Strain UTEX LB 2760" /LENGTH=117 /DNA_ID=CAMNT_0027232387 /DNA_START=638 /DNA_END=991 /DNA_ORIENTATION=+
MSALSWQGPTLLASPPEKQTCLTRISAACSALSRITLDKKLSPSATARTKFLALWLMLTPTNAPRRSASQNGVRSPSKYGRKIGGSSSLFKAVRTTSSKGWPEKNCSEAHSNLDAAP